MFVVRNRSFRHRGGPMMSDSPSIRAFGEKEKPADIETLLEKVITLADEDSENEDDVKYLGTSCSVVNPKKRHISPTRNGKENSTLFNFKRLRLLTPRDYFKQVCMILNLSIN